MRSNGLRGGNDAQLGQSEALAGSGVIRKSWGVSIATLAPVSGALWAT